MYVLDTKKPLQYHATSTDGMTFTTTEEDVLRLTADGDNYIASNPLVADDDVRMFGFSLQEKNIRSFVSQDGASWMAESGVRLTPTEEALHGGTYLQDSTVVQVSDGSYLLIYVTDLVE